MRTVRYERQGLTMEMAVSPISEGIKYRAINGRVPNEPKFRATGLDVGILPWW